MKTLFVLRHAKSSWKDDSLSDHDRPLNKRGKRAAPRMGRWARVHEVWPDVVLCSTAVRARKTAEAFLDAGKYETPLLLEPDMYHCDVPGMVELIRPRTEHAVMIVGHNPGLEDLVASISQQPVRFVTAAFAWIELPIESWSDLTEDVKGHLRALWKPRELPEAP